MEMAASLPMVTFHLSVLPRAVLHQDQLSGKPPLCGHWKGKPNGLPECQ